MNIYVEHEKEFYDFTGFKTEKLLHVASINFESFPDLKTTKRDFDIGARVYFENVGWTEVVDIAYNDRNCYKMCAVTYGCNSDRMRCGLSWARKDEKTVYFKKLKQAESAKPADVSDAIKDVFANSVQGVKHDAGKLRPALIPVECIKAVAEVMTFGADKYSPNNWQKVPEEKYLDALWRHYIAWKIGEKNDEESGLLHAAHFATNALFLLWFELEKEKAARMKTSDDIICDGKQG